VLFFLIRLVVPDYTTGRGPDKTMVTGDMAGNAADCCAL
jgi:hypothetical protein